MTDLDPDNPGITDASTPESPPRHAPPTPSPPLAPQGSLPLTPPLSPGSGRKVKSSQTDQSHQQYLDSLQPPSNEEFQRLKSLQEAREEEHRHPQAQREELQRQSRAIRRRSMEARRDFMHAKVVEEDHRRSHTLPPSSHSLEITHHDAPDGPSAHIESIRSKAAIVIQRTYRGYRVRREIQGLTLSASTRWTHALRDIKWQQVTMPRARADSVPSEANNPDGRPSTSRSIARQNWMKVATIARRAGGDEDSDHSLSSSPAPTDAELQRMSSGQRAAAKAKKAKAQAKRQAHAKSMGLPYFLEMVDLKHRYGSNLRMYHQEWKKSDTNENFFYWLDYGEGRQLDLTSCPRERLDREQVRYLNREERQYYLVKVDLDGRLTWAKNGVRIDTTEQWKDSIHGIVPADDPTPAFAPDIEKHIQAKPTTDASPQPHDHSSSSSGGEDPDSSVREAELEAAAAAKYANPEFDEAKGVKKIRQVSAATLFNKLLRKSVRKNTWIFVADTAFRLYVGIKSSGAFQHSSFLQGARISAAGLIKVKDGRLSSLSPLSGHYRPPASNFRAFVHSLEDEGADMSHVSISKAYAVLVGLETYVKARRKGKSVAQRLARKKQAILEPEAARRQQEQEMDKSESAAKERRLLARQREEEDLRRTENKASAKFIKKLGLKPRTPEGQKVGTNGGG